MDIQVKEELPFQTESTGLSQGVTSGTSEDGPDSSSTTGRAASHSPKAFAAPAGVMNEPEPEYLLSSAVAEISGLAVSPKVSVYLSKRIPGESQEIADIKKETVTPEYTLEWWCEMGPVSSNIQHRDANKNIDFKPVAILPRTKSAKVEDCGFKVHQESTKMKLGKREYREEGGVANVKNDGDGRNRDKQLLETQISEHAVSALDSKMSSMSLATPPGGRDSEEGIHPQEETALNLSLPKRKRDTLTQDQIQPLKENTPFLNSHKANTDLHSNASSDIALAFRTTPEAQSVILSSGTLETSPAASTSFLQVNDHHQHLTSSDSYFPWMLGLCRAPCYAHPPMANFTPISLHSCTNVHTYPAIRNQLTPITGLPVSFGDGGNNRIDFVVSPTTRPLESFVAPYASLPISHIGAIGSGTGSAIQTSLQPVAIPNDHCQLSQHPGILFLTSQSVCPQPFPFLPQRGELTNQGIAKTIDSHAPNKLPIKRISANVSKEQRSAKKCKSHFQQEDTSAEGIETTKSQLNSKISDKVNLHFKATGPQKEVSDSKASDPIKKGKTIRKTKFMEARDFVDPTMIKLSHDDEVSDDNELMTDLINNDNNSSDEEWIPGANKVKAGSIFIKNHENSSSDEARKGKNRKLREARRNRSNICRRGRPISKAVACPTCGKVFHGKYHLNRHEMSHTETRPFECSICGKKFKQKAHLQGHEMIHKRQRSKPKQKIVKSPLDSREEVESNKFSGRPKKNYSEKELSCTTCQKSFKTLYRLKRHVQSHTDERPHSCRVCGKGFKQTGHRNEHEANHEKNRRKFLCNMCGVIFRCRSSFNNHLKAHRGEGQPPLSRNATMCSVNPTADQEYDIQCNSNFTRTGYDCPYCSDKFSTAQGLNRHLDSHIEVHQRLHVQPYTCKHCSRSFTYKHNMMKHMLAHLAPEKYALYHKAKLEQHVASGKPCFKCNTCSKMFIRKETLVKHLKIHTGCKPFKCMICTKEFSQNVHLKVHMRKHTGNRPFQCKLCNRGFIDSTSLAKHIEYEACVIENVFFTCKICDKRHYYMGSIKQHIVRQHGETEFEQYIQRIQKNRPKPRKLKNEKSSHDCQVCTSTFTEKGNLVRHVKRKHSDLMKMFHENMSMGESSHSSLCSANSSTNNDCHEAISQSSEETKPKSNGFHTRGNGACQDDRNESLIHRGNSLDSEKHALETECSSAYATSSEISHDKIRSEVELSRQEEAKKDFIFSKNQLEDDSQTTSTLSLSAAKPSDSGVLESHDKCDIGGKTPSDIESTTTIRNTTITSATPCHESGRNNDCDVPIEDVHENGQNNNAVSFLYQFGLVASNKARRERGDVDKEMPTSWSTEPSKEFTSNTPESVSGNKEGEKSTLKCLVSSKVDEDFGKHSDKSSLTIDLSGQSQVPHSDFELFCNLALMSEKGGLSNLRADNTGSHQFSGVVGDSECADCSDGCQSNVHDTCRQTKKSPDDGLAEGDSCNNDPSRALGLRKGAGHNDEFSLTETYTQVKPWLHELFGKSTRLHRRTPRPSTRSTAIKAGGSTDETNAVTKETAQDIRQGQIDLHSRSTLHAQTATTKSMADASDAQSEKPLDKETSVENEEILDGKTVSLVEGTAIEACPSRFESQSVIEDEARHYLTSAVALPHKTDTAADTDSPSLVIALPAALCFESSHAQATKSSDAEQLSHSDETKDAAAPPFAEVTDLSLASRKSSKEATTQTLAPVEFVSPGSVLSSPLDMTLPLRTSDEQPTVPAAGFSNRQPGPLRSKESFPCPKCGKCFNARHQLKRHEMTHTEIRPYGCPECGRAFRQKVHLSDHLKRHGGLRPFACQACGKSFVLKNELKQHAKNYCRRSASADPADPQTTWKRRQLLPVPVEGLPDLDGHAESP